jgi:uncharacterized membrane protein YgcG
MMLAVLAAAAVPLAALPTCSLQNVEGPDVTCADLECGRINACRDGIIAQCLDGKTVRYDVCKASADDVCEEDWQIPGQYRCLEFETDCEGCRPERVHGCAGQATGGGAGGGGGGASGGGAGGGAGGSGGL